MRSAPRKRPCQQRSRDTVRAILDASADLLEAEGIEGYNTNAIAAGAGVSIGSVYQYFPGKDAITLALLDRETAELLDEAAVARAQPGSREALIHFVNAAVEHQLRRPLLARLIDVEVARLPGAAEHRSVAMVLTDLVAELLARPGLPRAADRLTAAADLVAILTGMVDSAGARGEHDAPALARRVRGAVFGYLDRAHDMFERPLAPASH